MKTIISMWRACQIAYQTRRLWQYMTMAEQEALKENWMRSIQILEQVNHEWRDRQKNFGD